MKTVVRTAAVALVAVVVGSLATVSTSRAADQPARITFLAASCPASSSMYTRVVAGQDPSSNENGTPAAPSDITAYGCTASSGLNFFLLASSTANSIYLDSALTNPAARSSSDAGPAGATLIPSDSTGYVTAGASQTRRISVSNYPTTITSRAAMPFLDLQCGGDGINNDNADGIGWDNTSLAAGSQQYCIAYVWDGVAPATPTPTATPTTAATATPTPATATATPTAAPTNTPGPTNTPASTPTATPTSTPTTAATPASTTSKLTVNFPGISSVHVYAHEPDGVNGTAGGKQVGSATWKDNSAALTVAKGTYDVRVVDGPRTLVFDGINCASDCTVDVPLATLTVNFPGLKSVHSYAHMPDGSPGTYGAQYRSSTWKDDSTTMTVVRGIYDVRVVHGPVTAVIDNVDCSGATCSATVPLATLTVNFPGLKSAHTYAHVDDGVAGTYGAQDSASTWKDDSTSLVLLRGMYDVRVVHGPMTYVLDSIDCTGATCEATVPLATLTVNFPGMRSVHSYAHKSDGAPNTYGAQDSSSTWKDDATTMTLVAGVYDVRVVHGPVTLVFDDIDCRGLTCSVDVPLATLTVNFPGLTSAHTYAHVDDGAVGSYGAQDSSSTWKDNSATILLLRGLYDVRVVHGPMTSVIDGVSCLAATCEVNVPLAALSVDFQGRSSVHTYVRADDGVENSASGAQDSSSTWKNNATSFVLLRGIYDVLMREGSKEYIVDAVDCRSATCAAKLVDGSAPVATATPTPVPAKPAVQKTFVSATDTTVTWRLEPSFAADLLVWDAGIDGCEEFGGASCSQIVSGGAGTFSGAGTGQYLLVSQPYEASGESCKVTNTAEWAVSALDARQAVSASYECSGASTMGWGLFALFATGAVGMAWVVQRKYRWSH